MVHFFLPATGSVLAALVTQLALGAGDDGAVVGSTTFTASVMTSSPPEPGTLDTSYPNVAATSEAVHRTSESGAAKSRTSRGAAVFAERQLGLQDIATISGDTTNAPVPLGNPTTSCASSSRCINGCRSLFYTVVGTGGQMGASPCDPSTNFSPEVHLWEGSTCYNFKCGPVNLRSTCNVGGRAVPQVYWRSEAGVEYHIQVTGEASADAGSFVLHIVGTGPAIPLVPFINGAF
jgi:hypothetical protein